MQKITLIETQDGKLFQDEESAKEHICSRLCTILDKALNSINDESSAKKYTLKRHHIMDIVEHLVGDYDKATDLIYKLCDTLE